MNLYASILIPIFNESSNIENCIQNLKKQTCQNFEVVFVDDGSTDNSMIVLNRVIRDNPDIEIQLFQQTNQGAAAARYLAAKNAKYDYISRRLLDPYTRFRMRCKIMTDFCTTICTELLSGFQ